MESKNYIIKKLQELHDKFPMLSIKYKYDALTQMHIVDIMPLDEYESNQEYIKYEADLSFEFDNMFYPESVMFVSADSLTQIVNPEFIIDPVIITSLKNEACIESPEEVDFTIECFDNSFNGTGYYYLAA